MAMRIRWIALVLLVGLSVPGLTAPAFAQDPDHEQAVMAVVEASLEALSREDLAAFAAYLLDETVTIAVTADGDVGRYSAIPTETWREMVPTVDFVERGFNAKVHVSGPVASVWLPYDFYIDGELSHCGIDVFTLIKTSDGWRVSGLTFTRQQPPACPLHPDGPPTN